MVGVKIELGFYSDLIIKGESAYDVFCELQDYQDLGCLVGMGRLYEPENEKQFDALEEFMDKACSDDFTIDDFKMLDISLGIGNIKVLAIAHNDEELAKLE